MRPRYDVPAACLTTRRDDAECVGPALRGAGQPHSRTDEVVEIVRRVAQGDSSIRRPEIQGASLVLEHPVHGWLSIDRYDGEIADHQLTAGGGRATHSDLQSRDPSQGRELRARQAAASAARRAEQHLGDWCVPDDGDRALKSHKVALRR